MTEALRHRLHAALRIAMKERDSLAVQTLRTALAAIDTAEAVPVPPRADTRPTDSPIAGARHGAGAGDVPRQELSEGDVRAIVRAEIDDLLAHAEEYHGLGEPERASRLRAQAELLEAQLST
jgi:uncharacterized protein YqeY